MTSKYIKSVKDFEEKYFPKAHKKKIDEETPPEKIGVLWARDTMNKLKKNLKIFA